MGVSNSSYYEQEDKYLNWLYDILEGLDTNTYQMLCTIGYIIRPLHHPYVGYCYLHQRMEELVYKPYKELLEQNYNISTYEEFVQDLDKHLKEYPIDPVDIFREAREYITLLKETYNLT
jgi:hypothetical protein